MDIELRHLKLILTVADEGSLTKAGNRLHLTQSALSHQLRDVEGRLGVQLFRRLNKKMLLTPAGERLLRSAQKVKSELEQVGKEIHRMANGQSGELRISTECYTCYHWLPAVLKKFNKAFPNVEVNIVVEATRRPLQALLSGKIDLAIASAPIPHPKLRYEPLFEDELVAIMSPDHPLRRRRYLEAGDFADQHLFVYSLPDEEITILRQVLIPAGIAPRRLSRVQLTEAIMEFVKAGLGISVMARWAVMPHVKSGALIARPVTKEGLFRQYSAGLIAGEPTPKYVQEFIKLISRKPLPAS
jgi:LysR family transcriptional regulator for metE and metH